LKLTSKDLKAPQYSQHPFFSSLNPITEPKLIPQFEATSSILFSSPFDSNLFAVEPKSEPNTVNSVSQPPIEIQPITDEKDEVGLFACNFVGCSKTFFRKQFLTEHVFRSHVKPAPPPVVSLPKPKLKTEPTARTVSMQRTSMDQFIAYCSAIDTGLIQSGPTGLFVFRLTGRCLFVHSVFSFVFSR
jgi:hypothetical protein